MSDVRMQMSEQTANMALPFSTRENAPESCYRSDQFLEASAGVLLNAEVTRCARPVTGKIMEKNSQDEIGALLAPMLKKTLFVALSKAVAPSDQMFPYVADHLRYMNELEKRGILFASGPFVQEGVLVGDGLTILRAESLEQARKLMEEEPLIKLGMRTFDLKKWELREGRISIHLDASQSSFILS
jgi:uncharacterized protein